LDAKIDHSRTKRIDQDKATVEVLVTFADSDKSRQVMKERRSTGKLLCFFATLHSL
jgi:ACT domain-containing protein